MTCSREPHFFARDGAVFARSAWGGFFLTHHDVEKMVAAWSTHPDERPPFARAVCEEMLADLILARDEADAANLDIAA